MLDTKIPEPNGNDYYADYSPYLQKKKKKKKKRILFWVFLALIFLGMAFVASIAFAYKFYATSKKVIDAGGQESFLTSIKDIASPAHKQLRGEERGRINVLLIGLAGENYPGENLTDSIIIASINPKTYQTALLSIPRDLFVQIPETNSYTKINALYARAQNSNSSGNRGIKDLKLALTDITGLDIDYYVALDFDGFGQTVDELGGIKIQVPKDIHDERYPGPNYSYQTFDVKKGLYTFDGETGLKYARTRHDEDGDFGRAYRQQQILESVRQKAFSLGTILNIPAINRILGILGDHLRTDIRLDEIDSFLNLAEKVDSHTTINKVLDAGKPDSVMAVSHVMLGGARAFILVPRTGSYNETRDLAQNIFDLGVLEQKKSAIADENISIFVVNRSGSATLGEKLVKLIRKLGYDVKMSQFQSKRNPSIPTNSTIYDLVKTKPFSLEDLSKKLSIKISSDLPNDFVPSCSSGDFCLIAGSDLLDKIDYEENTTEELEEGYDKQVIDEKTYIDLLKKGSELKFTK